MLDTNDHVLDALSALPLATEETLPQSKASHEVAYHGTLDDIRQAVRQQVIRFFLGQKDLSPVALTRLMKVNRTTLYKWRLKFGLLQEGSSVNVGEQIQPRYVTDEQLAELEQGRKGVKELTSEVLKKAVHQRLIAHHFRRGNVADSLGIERSTFHRLLFMLFTQHELEALEVETYTKID